VRKPLPIAPDGATCWSSIGVHGDRSCPELPAVVHCRSCPVLSDAALTLFERETSDARGEVDAELADRAAAEEPSLGSMLVFRLGDEWLGLRTSICAFVSDTIGIRRLAGRSGAVFLGLCVCRGEMTLAASLRGLLSISAPPEEKRSWIAVGEAGSRWVFDVDEIRGVRRWGRSQATRPPGEATPTARTYVSKVLRIDGMDVGLLDDELVDEALRRSLGA
jgi:chemotaxis signal transduction protein